MEPRRLWRDKEKVESAGVKKYEGFLKAAWPKPRERPEEKDKAGERRGGVRSEHRARSGTASASVRGSSPGRGKGPYEALKELSELAGGMGSPRRHVHAFPGQHLIPTNTVPCIYLPFYGSTQVPLGYAKSK